MPEAITAAGGFCAPLPEPFFAERRSPERHEVHPNYVATRPTRLLRNRLRNYFAWDKGWGFPLLGVYIPTMREMMPVFSAARGGIRFG